MAPSSPSRQPHEASEAWQQAAAGAPSVAQAALGAAAAAGASSGLLGGPVGLGVGLGPRVPWTRMVFDRLFTREAWIWFLWSMVSCMQQQG